MNVQKFGIGLNMYFMSSKCRIKASIGNIKTVPDILKIANACTLFCANDVTSRAINGVNRQNNTAIGRYATYENCVSINSPESGGNINSTINENIDMKSILYIRYVFLDIGITLSTVSKCSSLSSIIKNAVMKPKIIGINVLVDLVIIHW